MLIVGSQIQKHCFKDKSAAEKAKKTLIELVTAEINKKSHDTRSASPQPSTSTSTSSEPFKDGLSIRDNVNEMFGDVEQTQFSPQASAITEVQRYLAGRLLPIKDEHGKLLDPSDWWRNHQFVYPNLAQLYRNKCCAMSTSVSCERIYSISGNIITERRTRLKSEKVKQFCTSEVYNSNSTFFKNMFLTPLKSQKPIPLNGIRH